MTLSASLKWKEDEESIIHHRGARKAKEGFSCRKLLWEMESLDVVG